MLETVRRVGVLGLGRMGAAIRRNILKPGLLRAAHESHRVAAPVVAHGLGAKDVSVAYEITRMLAGHP